MNRFLKTAFFVVPALLLLAFVFESLGVLVYLPSFAYHGVNLQAFVFRRTDAASFAVRSVGLRSLAFGLLAVLAVWSGDVRLSAAGLSLLAGGLVLHALAVRALGLTRTCYGMELGAVPRAAVTTFPYNAIAHPMHAGSVMQFAGAAILCPALGDQFPLLIAGHVALTVLTAFVEHVDLHVEPRTFRAIVDRFSDEDRRRTVDAVRDWSLRHFSRHLHRECSMHRYVETLPREILPRIDELRYADEVLGPIRSAFPGSALTPLPMTDEIYVSRYNYDRGGDQGLFDRHYDGNLRFLPGGSVVRSLIYLSADDRLEVVFDTSGTQANMRTYMFGLLDFHNELHWVNGSYEPDRPPRVLLKCNYYVDHWGWAPWGALGIVLNVAVFYVVKATMEYSKSPRTPAQRGVGFVCNLFRRLNVVSPAAPVVVVLAVLALAVKMVAAPLAGLF